SPIYPLSLHDALPISGDFLREQGVYAINHQRQIALRANVHGQLRDNLDLSVNTGYVQNRLRLPQNDNNVRGLIPQGLLGGAQDRSEEHTSELQSRFDL